MTLRRAYGICRWASRGRDRGIRSDIEPHIGLPRALPATHAAKSAHGVDPNFSLRIPFTRGPEVSRYHCLAAVIDLNPLNEDRLVSAVLCLGESQHGALIGFH